MAAHQLDGTVGQRNPHTLGWFCRCTIKEDTPYLAMPICADASRDGRAIRPLRIPRPRASRDNPAPDQIRTALPPLPAASRMPSRLTAAAVTNVPGRTSSRCRPLAVSETRTRGLRPAPPAASRGAVRADCPSPGPPRWTGCRSGSVIRDCGSASLPWPSCRSGGQAGGLAAGVPAGADPDGVEAGRGPGRGRRPLPARRTGTGGRLAVRAVGLLAANRACFKSWLSAWIV
jgi:hypothetical protein